MKEIDDLMDLLIQEIEWAVNHKKEVSKDEYNGYINGLEQAQRFIRVIKNTKQD